MCPFSQPPELDTRRGVIPAPKGLPVPKVDSEARPASAAKSVTMSSNRCPIKRVGERFLPFPYVK